MFVSSSFSRLCHWTVSLTHANSMHPSISANRAIRIHNFSIARRHKCECEWQWKWNFRLKSEVSFRFAPSNSIAWCVKWSSNPSSFKHYINYMNILRVRERERDRESMILNHFHTIKHLNSNSSESKRQCQLICCKYKINTPFFYFWCRQFILFGSMPNYG